MSSLCVVPARRNSKTMHEKVFRTIGGKTLLARGLDIALESGCADTVVLTTEDAEIAEVGREAGVAVHERSVDLQGDTASAADVALEVVGWIEQQQAEPVEVVLFLSPVYPLLAPEDVRTAWDQFQKSDADFLVSVVRTDPHDFHWALVQEGELARPYFGNGFMVDRVDLPPIYSPTGAIKIGRVDAIRQAGNFFGDRLATIELPRERSVYVRAEHDLRFAELLVSDRSSNR